LALLDKLSYSVLSKSSFWEEVYKQNVLQFNLQNKPSVPAFWCLKFDLAQRCVKYASMLIHILKTRTLHVCHNVIKVPFRSDDINDYGLQIPFSQCTDITIFDVPDVDMNIISLFYDFHVISKFNKISEPNFNEKGVHSLLSANIFGCMYISYEKDAFQLVCGYLDEWYETKISEESAQIILMRLLEKGIIPENSMDRNVPFEN
jgi:hypothetical protein